MYRNEPIEMNGGGGGVIVREPPLPPDDPPVVVPTEPPVQPPQPEAPVAVPPPRPEQQPVALFGEFRFVGNGEVRATAPSGALPPVIAAPLGTVPRGMVFVEREVLREADADAPNGVGYLYYEGVWDALPDFNALKPLKTGTADSFTLSVRERDEQFALLFNGHVSIPAAGTYTFFTSSDDGSRLWIGSTLVVNNDGLHGAQERSGTIQLTPGRHEIMVAFFQKLGGLALEVRYEGPGLSKQLIPNGALFRSDALYLYQAGNFRPALGRTPGRFALPYAHQDEAVGDRRPLFYEDTTRTFFVEPSRSLTLAAELIESDSTYVYTFSSVAPREAVAVPADQRWRFRTFYHPYVSACIRELNRHGVPGLFNRNLQTAPHTLAQSGQPLNFLNDYQPVPATVAADAGSLPVDEVDVSAGGAYSLYNWELFFHAPLMIADRLSQNQRFEEAQQWLHYIFDPTDRSGGPTPDRFWRFKRFQGVAQESVQELLEALSSGQRETELRNQVNQWRNHPFNAHLIARLRLPAYQKAVVMKYIDNLIAWGDQLFRLDTVEAINDATLLYVFAAELLGPRPQTLGARDGAAPRTFAELNAAQDDFLVRIETLLPPDAGTASEGETETPELLTAPYYFCIPKNEALLRYWDTVADRLFKIRHCQNIEGAGRQLPLFEPPLDPGLLVRAAAAGVDIGSSLNDVNAPLPHYRFRVMAQKAAELCVDLKALGSSLLAALEKRDAEAAALLRSGHELRLLAAVRGVKERQVEEAHEAVEVLRRARQLADLRFEHYNNAEFMNQWERAHLALTGTSAVLQAVAQVIQLSSAGAKIIPDVEIGVAGWAASPFATVKYGGTTAGGALEKFGDALSMLASLAGAAASMSATMGSYQRRADEWELQKNLAAKEQEQIDRQILAAEIRAGIAERELDNHDLQAELSEEVDTFMRDKFTNRELYDWMVSQLAAVYFQSYQLAYDVARRAQRAYQHECGAGDTFVEFGHWDSLRKGLLAGEKLHHDLKRMEAAYLDRHRRDYELTKHVSLALIDPAALLTLRQTGECFVELPEELFDLDHPGHYLRRIKTLNVTIPSITGPYTGINCTITLLWNTVRRDASLPGGAYARARSAEGVPLDDARFLDNVGAIQSIATSSAREDSGLFEQNLNDERYLPFEGAGAISRWRIQLPKETNHFDFSTITDAIFTVRYTARDGGEPLRAAALEHVREVVRQSGTLFRAYSARHNFPDAWHRFFAPAQGDPRHVLELRELRKYVPPVLGSSALEIKSMFVVLSLRDGVAYDAGSPFRFNLAKDGTRLGGEHLLTFDVGPFASLPAARVLSAAQALDDGTWQVSLDGSQVDSLQPELTDEEDVGGTAVKILNSEAIEDVWLVIGYGIED